jgi:GDP-L-fucose synthase
MKKVLITGGSGLVGYGIKSHVYKYPDYEFKFLSSHNCNLLDYQQSLEFFYKYKPDYVIHLAANVGGLYKNMNNKVEMFEDNLQMNLNVLKICYKLGVKKVVSCLSTCIFPDQVVYPINESQLHLGPPHWSNDGYAYAKRMLAIQSQLYREQYGCNFICVIPTNIYGINDNFNLIDAHVIPALIHKCYLAKKNNKDFIINGSGKPLRQFIYNKDLGELILWTLFNYNQKDEIILSPSEEISIKEVGEIIGKEFDYEFKVEGNDDNAQYKKTADNSKLLSLLDYKFTSLETGLKETIEWFKNNYDLVRK